MTSPRTLSVTEFRARIDALLLDTSRELERTRHFTDSLRAGVLPRAA
jgi:hypothetical protein